MQKHSRGERTDSSGCSDVSFFSEQESMRLQRPSPLLKLETTLSILLSHQLPKVAVVVRRNCDD